jgi:uncharacterized membrane protein YqaE (UPF0057 family)
MTLIAIFLPPLAMLMKGRPVQALLCLVLMATVLGWPLASIWAISVVNSAREDARTRRIIGAVRTQ